MDPYCTVEINGILNFTKVHEDAGINPYWGEEFEMPYKSIKDIVYIRVLDSDTKYDDIIGESLFKIEELVYNFGIDGWYPILFKGKEAGTIWIKTKDVPKKIVPSSN